MKAIDISVLLILICIWGIIWTNYTQSKAISELQKQVSCLSGGECLLFGKN